MCRSAVLEVKMPTERLNLDEGTYVVPEGMGGGTMPWGKERSRKELLRMSNLSQEEG